MSFTDNKRPLLSVGVIPVYMFKGEYKVLLLRAYNYWDFPKGLMNPGETQKQTALRELKEETQIFEAKFKWGDATYDTSPYGQGKIARYYIAASTSPAVALLASPELGRPEHHEYRWVSFNEARKLVNARLQPVVDWAEKTIIEGSQHGTL